jgi:hypothetical protein
MEKSKKHHFSFQQLISITRFYDFQNGTLPLQKKGDEMLSYTTGHTPVHGQLKLHIPTAQLQNSTEGWNHK